jgi:excisionase family DNA binding protein
MAATKKLLTVKQASEMLSIAPITLYQWARERRIPSVRIQGCLRFKLEDMERLIEQGTVAVRKPL